jgi:hypothetical protein
VQLRKLYGISYSFLRGVCTLQTPTHHAMFGLSWKPTGSYRRGQALKRALSKNVF